MSSSATDVADPESRPRAQPPTLLELTGPHGGPIPIPHMPEQDQKQPRAGTWSLKWRLPLLMTVLLAVMLGTSLVITYAALSDSASDTATRRLERATNELADLSAAAVQQGSRRMATLAADTLLTRALLAIQRLDSAEVDPHPDVAAAAAFLGRQIPASDGRSTMELWSTSGRRVAFAGQDLGEDRSADQGYLQHSGRLEMIEALDATDSVRFSPLVQRGDVVIAWIVAPVRVQGQLTGYLTRSFRLTASAQTQQTLRALSGTEVSVYYRNTAGDQWTTLGGDPTVPPASTRASDSGFLAVRDGVGELFMAEAPVPGTPYTLVLERPVQSALTSARGTIKRLGVASVLLLLVGSGLTFLLGRRTASPLAALSKAAEAVARGELDVRVEPTGADELVRLATSFNHMASEVAASRVGLERQNHEAIAAAEQAERLNRELEMALQSLRQREVDAREARRQAELANRAKSDFLAVMSHELRTPLNAIGGYTELLQLGLRGPINEEQHRDLERIQVSQQHLLGLISSVLDLSRIEAGRVTYELAAVPLHEFLTSLDPLVRPQMSAKSLDFRHLPCDPMIAVLADREKLRQILLNLLSNAIRYTGSGGRIDLSVARASGETVSISVSDTGIGISPDALESVFEPFVQLDRSLTQARDGVGLGLAISHDLARGMNGGIVAHSEVGVGSRFTVTLPLVELEPAETSSHPFGTRTVRS